MSGQSIMDRVQAARHSIAGQGLAKSVCKATTEEIIGPKKKHLDYLIQCTNEPNVSIPQLADLLIERTQHQNWIVVYKSLITIHNLMNYGNERFTQYLASNNCTFNLGGFIDKTGVQGYDMSTYIRRYAKYLNEKATSYRQMAFDFCKVKRGKDDGLLRQMNSEKLLKALPVLQAQLNALIEFDCTPNELTNGVINACFMLLFKDLIRLFACYNDGIINLLEKYFDMNKKQCKEGLDIYKKFLVSMDKVSEFLKVAENVGIDRGDIPDLAKGLKNNTQNAPASLLDALEQHLQSLEGKKGVVTTTSTPKPAGFASALTTISNNSAAINVSEDEKKRILDEENMRLAQLKEQRLKELQSGGNTPTDAPNQPNPFTAAGDTSPKAMDLFGPNSPTGGGPTTNGKPSDDLLSLNANPFAQSVEAAMATAYGGQQQPQSNNPFAGNAAGGGGGNWGNAGTGNAGNFGGGSEVDFATAFNNTSAPQQGSLGSPQQPTPVLDNSQPPGSLGSPQQPTPVLDNSQPPGFVGGDYGLPPAAGSPAHMPRSTTPTYLETGFDAFGEVLQPANKGGQMDVMGKKKMDGANLLAGDLDTSLSSLAGNLHIGGPAQQVKKAEHQWNPKGEHKLTGGANWQGQGGGMTGGMGGGMTAPGWNQQQPAGGQFQQPMMAGGQVVGGYGQPGMMQQPMMGGMGQPQMMGAGGMGMGGMVGQPQMGYGGAGMTRMQQPMGVQQQRPQSNATNDPFGAL